jgi:predicted ATP-dependent Lon-type protease
MPKIAIEETEHISLCETLDRVLNKGAVVVGDITISVANVDLLYLQLNLVLTSIETARRVMLPMYNASSGVTHENS